MSTGDSRGAGLRPVAARGDSPQDSTDSRGAGLRPVAARGDSPQDTTPAPRAGGRLKATVMDGSAMRRSLTRIAHEIVERNQGVDGVVVVGILSRGDVLARRLAAKLSELERVPVPAGRLDVSRHRDDRPQPDGAGRSEVPPLDGRTVVLVDDVLYHGRTARAALDALLEFGRPQAVQLAVLIDRGHRELPIRADYVGKNVPTSEAEQVEVCLEEVDGAEGAVILGR